MKVKTLVAMGVSSLLAVSIAYATPSALNAQFVDDATGSTPPAINDVNANPGAMDSNNSAANPGAAPSDANMSNGNGDTSNATAGSDEDTQDTATGDSDY